MVICFFGDSLTLGFGDPSGLGWPGRVTGQLITLGADVTGYNLGIRKDIAAKLSDRWQREAELRLLPGMEHKLVFSLGVADVMNEVPADDTLAVAETILTQAKTFGEVLLVGPTPVGNNRQTDAIADLSDRLAELCETLDVPFVAVMDPMRKSGIYQQALKDGDSIHPSAMGYAALAECVLQSITARKYFGLD
ncbi:GDSL-type esterase/lipase family protein [Pseudodesulfovibrio portus]|uniref:Arylesterase n=1 Tax=Pseudodesulfovibrio portus TaxID=231439 RepID=A0ABN6RVK8_9BACT|nr:GDSL-type esterase/lipase family protein [Pseudodesulfovibrio portus]BDQ35124.1 arylesterase [Pseudodesulfovibrio portus]